MCSAPPYLLRRHQSCHDSASKHSAKRKNEEKRLFFEHYIYLLCLLVDILQLAE